MTKWSPSLRTKVIFFCLASLILLGFCLTLAVLYTVDTRKRQIVADARDLAQSSAEQFGRRLEQLFEEEQAQDLASLRRSDGFEQYVRILLTDRRTSRTMVYMLYDREGRLEYRSAPELAEQLEVRIERVADADLAQARHAVLHGGQHKGDVVVTYAPDVLVGRIQQEGRRITVRLAGLAGALSVLLAMTFLLLWRVFKRHLERERAHEQLDRLAYVGTLASGLAHEIRNPLNAMNLNLDLIGEEMQNAPPETTGRTRQILDLLKAEIGRLSSTLTSFLQFALPTHRRLQMTDVVAVLHETAALLSADMRARRIHYRFEGERSCATLADPNELRQVFWNILLNAVQAVENRPERRIESRCFVDDGSVAFEVRDSGPGIAPELRQRVFEVFYSTRRAGSGFGLAIARQIVQRHNGTIRIDSVDGWGCVVHVQLPLKVAGTAGNGPS